MSTEQDQTQESPLNNEADSAVDEAVEQAQTQADAGADAQGEPEVELNDVDQLQTELEQVKGEAADQVLRAQADAQNIRRRAEKDVEKARRYALEKFSNDFTSRRRQLRACIAGRW